ncbi:M4 family metallopeptidase [Variovorax sp. GB1P17]|uniref:M4 family metallopeptidase n=1 Tax=Variovorax sp. GB1P17 TaxID=3443740 RepID=UPI003F493E84
MQPETSGDVVAIRTVEVTAKLRMFLSEVLGRDSIDDRGMSIDTSIHYSRSYCNAFWDDDRCVFGDGDGLIFKDFTSSNDFVCHEVMHGITQYSADLDYENEAGALNESISDVFGVIFRQWAAGQDVSAADWAIGVDMMGPTALELGWTCLRDLASPDSERSMTKQPRRYSQYDPGGEPHINSGIPNHAFFAFATQLGRPSWCEPARIWYRALISPEVTTKTDFAKFSALTERIAVNEFSGVPGVLAAVRSAWSSVGVVPKI